MKRRFKALRGTRDILPTEVERWHFLERTVKDVFGRYGYREIRTPIFESTELFQRSVGDSTDIVRKEMYTFGSGEESLTLRPENTAPVVRAFVEHSLFREVGAGFPERLYYMGPMFRRERPQKGRQRQFHQIGIEVLGAAEPAADAEALQMLDLFLDTLGVQPRELVLGSVGDDACRPAYREKLRKWLKPKLPQLCEDCRRRYEENPLRVLDCKVEGDRELVERAPTIVEELCGDCETHFAQVRRLLDDHGVEYRVDGRMVRGLDYYRRTVFEVLSAELGAQNAILGGGRYDGLVRDLGGPELPGFGFAIGMERLVALIPERVIPRRRVDLSLVALGAGGFEACRGLSRRLRAAGLVTLSPLVERPMGSQLKRADKSGARFALFVGGKGFDRGLHELKDLASGDQVSLDEDAVIAKVRKHDGE